ncbi:putative phosphonate metabolism protein [Rhodovulum imhoffii]|uniref:Putative phosphonate metabolism protein n=1 Tax=Rhodovulum imhoffii TaxID=365340 RepID=A0A2T5BPY5_9RHOB|nr:DUF1045 domain-containing protein [Rhodovulum imhoffii]MBK5933080.1 phosphonate metabolism protein [Rhodovulum imhoffii]PTN01064.1 putative phosphonate metabolism protein [Rhodovulum imhoffii]
MEGYKRYAIYYTPEPGPLAQFGASWLGWDAKAARQIAHPKVPGLPRPVSRLTDTPRKYGFHATVKPPFRLVEGSDISVLHEAVIALAGQLRPVLVEGLALSRLGGFLALTPRGDISALSAMAGSVVEALDGFRAPPTQAELARRNPDRLSATQARLLTRWGYPYVMEEYRFHMTLTGKLPEAEAESVRAILAPRLATLLEAPLRIRSLCLFGEARDGCFHNLHRYTLTG